MGELSVTLGAVVSEYPAGGVYVQVCVSTGVPPVHPVGVRDVSVLVCCPLIGQGVGVQSV